MWESEEMKGEQMNFVYNVLGWEAEFEGFYGYGDTSEEAIEDLEKSANEDGWVMTRYPNGYGLEEYDKEQEKELAEMERRRKDE